MGLTILAIIGLMVVSTRRRQLVPGRMQSIAEVLYGFVHQMVEDIAGREGLRYFPYILTIFLFVLVANVLGLLPMSFTTTSHIAVTATMALTIFVAVTILGVARNGAGFLGLFWISSAPLALRPILAVIEVISYFVRPVSHSIRLAGNMMAGARGHQGLRRIRGRARNRVGGPDRGHHGGLRTGDAGGLHPGLRLHDSHVRVSERCTASTALSDHCGRSRKPFQI